MEEYQSVELELFQMADYYMKQMEELTIIQMEREYVNIHCLIKEKKDMI